MTSASIQLIVSVHFNIIKAGRKQTFWHDEVVRKHFLMWQGLQNYTGECNLLNLRHTTFSVLLFQGVTLTSHGKPGAKYWSSLRCSSRRRNWGESCRAGAAFGGLPQLEPIDKKRNGRKRLIVQNEVPRTAEEEATLLLKAEMNFKFLLYMFRVFPLLQLHFQPLQTVT